MALPETVQLAPSSFHEALLWWHELDGKAYSLRSALRREALVLEKSRLVKLLTFKGPNGGAAMLVVSGRREGMIRITSQLSQLYDVPSEPFSGAVVLKDIVRYLCLRSVTVWTVFFGVLGIKLTWAFGARAQQLVTRGFFAATESCDQNCVKGIVQANGVNLYYVLDVVMTILFPLVFYFGMRPFVKRNRELTAMLTEVILIMTVGTAVLIQAAKNPMFEMRFAALRIMNEQVGFSWVRVIESFFH